MNQTKDNKLQQVYGIESAGGYGNFEMKIFINANREFTETDKDNINSCADSLKSLIDQETIRVSPKHQKEMQEVRKEVIAIFDGYDIFVEEIPNGYSNGPYYKNCPWFMVTTRFGRIKIGWRKSVIVVDWTDSTIKHKAKELFPDEDVTKDDRYIHAWGYQKAKDYLHKIFFIALMDSAKK